MWYIYAFIIQLIHNILRDTCRCSGGITLKNLNLVVSMDRHAPNFVHLFTKENVKYKVNTVVVVNNLKKI